MVRLAGLLHLIRHAEGGGDPPVEIGADTLAAAIEIAEYLVPHAVEAYLKADIQIGAASAAEGLLSWLQDEQITETTVREAHQRLRHRKVFNRAKDVQRAMDELVRRGYVREVQTEKQGPGRPSRRYELNPAVIENKEDAA